MKEQEAVIKAYSKAELAGLYNVSSDTLSKWLISHEKELKKIGYQRDQQILTLAQVKFLFRDDKLGRP